MGYLICAAKVVDRADKIIKRGGPYFGFARKN